jgi:ribosomal protein L16 Arg81 hydroxylase
MSENETKHKAKVILNNSLSLEYNDKVFNILTKKKSLNCKDRKLSNTKRCLKNGISFKTRQFNERNLYYEIQILNNFNFKAMNVSNNMIDSIES